MDLLDLHQHRRERGLPTLSLLVGPRGLGLARWRRWAGARRLLVTGPDPEEALSALEPSLRQRTEGATAYDARQLADPFAQALLCGELRALPLATRWAGAAALSEPFAVLWSSEQLVEDLTRVLPLLEAAPAVPFAMLASTERAHQLAERAPTRSVTLAREGWVELRQEVGVERLSGLPAASARQLLEDGADEPLVERFREAARAVRDERESGQEGQARSAAEQFLYDRLASLPETAGLFELNVRLDFAHGPAPAQADLYARAARLVIEVDGAYFHLHPEQYRRDRRKDWLLQQHGYRTLRFLAEDVVERLDEVLAAVRAAVRELSSRGPR